MVFTELVSLSTTSDLSRIVHHSFPSPSCLSYLLSLPRVALQLLNSANEKLFASKEVLQVIMEFLEVCPSFCSHMHPTLFRKICQPLQQSQLWPALLRFLECNAGLLLRLPRSAVCNPLERLVKHVGVSERLVAVVEQLAELHKKSLNCEVRRLCFLFCLRCLS